MQNKLQELTDKLYNEGLSKGKQEGEEILAKANEQAAQIIADAQKQAEKILSDAEKKAEDLQNKVESDVRRASNQTLASTRNDIENLLVCKMTEANVSKALSSADYIKDIIKAVAEKFTTEGAEDLNLILPAKLQKDLEPFIKKELSSILKVEINASFSKKINGGFRIGPADGSYFISLTDETFNELISEYLRPATKKILFG